MNRRAFIAVIGGSSIALAPRRTRAQGSANTMTMPMSDDAYHSVRLAPKPNARPLLTEGDRNDLEHRLKCQCGTCVLDVFTCRTTDFSCPVSPSMHVDAMSLVAGGYDADEILAAFRAVYGERVLMSPVKEGFNWVGYLLPFSTLAVAGTGVLLLLRRWALCARVVAAPQPPIDATTDELDAIARAMRSDE